MSPEQYKEREEKRDLGFVNGFDSWKSTFYLILTHVQYLEERNESDEIRHTRKSEGMFGIMSLVEELTNKFEEAYKDEEWEDKDYILTTEEFTEKNLY